MASAHLMSGSPLVPVYLWVIRMPESPPLLAPFLPIHISTAGIHSVH
jgi:hypothetical protein